MKLAGKTVLLTGANGGIGSCLARELATDGAALILTGRDEPSLRRLQQTLPEPGRHQVKVVDLMSATSVHSLVKSCQERTGNVDILINNAGMSDFSFVASSDSEVSRALIELNLTVPVTLTASLLPALLRRPEAAVINIGSAFGSIGYPGFAVYGASKSGLRTFSEALRRELADSGVRVLYAAPRATLTPMNSSRVVAMNKALGNAMDDPETVAAAIAERVRKGQWGEISFGRPERFYAMLNRIFPRIIDLAMRQQLQKIRHFSRVPVAGNSLSEQEAV